MRHWLSCYVEVLHWNCKRTKTYYGAQKAYPEAPIDVVLHRVLAQDTPIENKQSLTDSWTCEIQKCNISNRWCSIVNVMAWSTILGREIVSLFPDVPYVLRTLYHKIITPLRKSAMSQTMSQTVTSTLCRHLN